MGEAKDLQLKLINAPHTKRGRKHRSSVFGVRLQHCSVTGFCSEPSMITSADNRESPLQGKCLGAVNSWISAPVDRGCKEGWGWAGGVGGGCLGSLSPGQV